MRKTCVFSIILLTLSVCAFAGPKGHRVDISLADPTTVAGVQLKAGQYQVDINAEQTVATFYHNGTEVAKAAVHSQTNSFKFDATEFTAESDTLKELHIGGTNTTLIVDGSAK
jgi:hypothetical protein